MFCPQKAFGLSITFVQVGVCFQAASKTLAKPCRNPGKGCSILHGSFTTFGIQKPLGFSEGSSGAVAFADATTLRDLFAKLVLKSTVFARFLVSTKEMVPSCLWSLERKTSWKTLLKGALAIDFWAEIFGRVTLLTGLVQSV